MDEHERNHLLQRIRELEQSNRRWKVVARCFALTIVAAVLGTGTIGGIRLMTSRTMMRQAEEEARRQADQAHELEMRTREDSSAAAASHRQQLEKIRQEKEKSDRERAGQKTSPKDTKAKN